MGLSADHQAELEAMRCGLHEEMRAVREAAYAAIGGFHAACQTAAKAHQVRGQSGGKR